MHQFDTDTTLTETGPHTLAAVISDSWSHIGIINGGFQLGLCAKAMGLYARKPEGLIVTGNYIAKCRTGPVEIRVETISSSRYFDRLQARLIQNGAEKLRAFGTFARRGGPSYEIGQPRPFDEVAPPRDCVLVDSGGRTRLFDSIDILIDPACSGWMTGRLSTEAGQKGWIRFHRPRSFDIPSVIMAADSFPPSVFSHAGLQKIVPTLEFSVQFASVPVTDTLACFFQSRYVTGEIITEDGVLRTPEGRLVAVSRQTALYRNT